MSGPRKILLWAGGIMTALGLFLGSIFTLLIVFDEVAHWRTLLRQGNYQQLDAVFSEMETETLNLFKPMAWIFSREIHQRFPNFAEVKESLSISVVEKKAASCHQATQKNGQLTVLQLQETEPGIFTSSPDESLCEVEYRVKNGSFGLNVMVGVGEIPESGSASMGMVTGEFGFLKPTATKTLSIKPDDAGISSRSYRIFVVAGQRQRLGPLDWITSARQDDEVKHMINRAERLGLIIISARYEIKK